MLIGEQALNTLRAYQPTKRQDADLLKAAVAIILRDTEQGTECLMMQRAKHERDPWSGQMAFPGGKIDPEDIDAKAAAIRESSEEVGVALTDDDYVGQLDDLYGLRVNGVYSVHVSCFVFRPQRELTLVGNHEVADLVWLPMQMLNEPDHAHEFVHPKNAALNMPSVLINEDKGQILWGLSLRMLANFHDLLGLPMNVFTPQQHDLLRGLEHRDLDQETRTKISQIIMDQR